jgi:hypothetical protein
MNPTPFSPFACSAFFAVKYLPAFLFVLLAPSAQSPKPKARSLVFLRIRRLNIIAEP